MPQTKRRDFIKTTGSAALGMSLAARAALAGAGQASRSGRRVKIGQIGTAHAHAAGKMSTLRKLVDDFEVVGVVEPDPTRREALQGHSAYQGLNVMTEDELLRAPGLEAVAVETAVGDLVPTARRCVAAGMHLHLDKPAGMSLPEFESLLSEARPRKLVVQLGYMFRHNPAFAFLFNAVQEGWLGEIFEIHGVISKALNAPSRAELAKLPGGTMFELGCHLIDPLVYTLGKPDKVTPYPRRTLPDQDTLADNCLAVFEYPKATCTIRSSGVEFQGQHRRQFTVCGTEGTIDIRPLEPPKLLLCLASARQPYGRGYQEVVLPDMPGRYDDQLQDLAQVIRQEKPNTFPYSHDLATHSAILEASGMPVD